MAEVFTRNSIALGTSYAEAYGAPNANAADRAVVLSMMVANVDGTTAATVTAAITDANDTLITGGTLAKTLNVPAGASVELIANKLVLKNGEKLKLLASAASDLEVTVSALEITA